MVPPCNFDDFIMTGKPENMRKYQKKPPKALDDLAVF